MVKPVHHAQNDLREPDCVVVTCICLPGLLKAAACREKQKVTAGSAPYSIHLNDSRPSVLLALKGASAALQRTSQAVSRAGSAEKCSTRCSTHLASAGVLQMFRSLLSAPARQLSGQAHAESLETRPLQLTGIVPKSLSVLLSAVQKRLAD